MLQSPHHPCSPLLDCTGLLMVIDCFCITWGFLFTLLPHLLKIILTCVFCCFLLSQFSPPFCWSGREGCEQVSGSGLSCQLGSTHDTKVRVIAKQEQANINVIFPPLAFNMGGKSMQDKHR